MTLQAGDSTTVLQTAYAQQQQKKQRTRGRSGRRGRRQGRGIRERIDWSSPERAGLDHPGRISETEKEYVRANLDEVNARRRQHDQRELDPDNPEDVERYGLLPQETMTKAGKKPETQSGMADRRKARELVFTKCVHCRGMGICMRAKLIRDGFLKWYACEICGTSQVKAIVGEPLVALTCRECGGDGMTSHYSDP